MTIDKNPLTFKKLLFWIFVITAGILSASVALVSFISVWIGIQYISVSGSWVPISAGTALFGFVSWLYLRTVRYFHYHIKKDDFFEI